MIAHEASVQKSQLKAMPRWHGAIYPIIRSYSHGGMPDKSSKSHRALVRHFSVVDVTDAPTFVQKSARRCLLRAIYQRLAGASFGCPALANSITLWGFPSGSGKGWMPVAAMMRTFTAAVPRQQTQPT
jgi:hypothetical protein